MMGAFYVGLRTIAFWDVSQSTRNEFILDNRNFQQAYIINTSRARVVLTKGV